MKPGQQFKIDSIEDLKEVYDPEKWYWPLKMEITDFEIGMNYAVNYNGNYLLLNKSDDYETIPNPFKKSKWQRIKDILEDPECERWEDVEEKPEPISTGMNNINEFIRSAKLLVQIAEISKERNELREELRVLREEVEKLKGELNLIKEQELAKEKQEAINKIHEIMRESLATKECCKEKPKESEDLKIKWNHCELEVKKYHWSNHLTLKIDDCRNECSIPIEKPEAIKIVNYLKKHFEIKD